MAEGGHPQQGLIWIFLRRGGGRGRVVLFWDFNDNVYAFAYKFYVIREHLWLYEALVPELQTICSPRSV